MSQLTRGEKMGRVEVWMTSGLRSRGTVMGGVGAVPVPGVTNLPSIDGVIGAILESFEAAARDLSNGDWLSTGSASALPYIRYKLTSTTV